MKILNDKTFKEVTAIKGRYVVIMTAPYCAACKPMREAVIREANRDNVPVATVDLMECPGIARKYSPKAVPCTVLFIDGKEKRRVIGKTARLYEFIYGD